MTAKDLRNIYDVTRKWAFILPTLAFPTTFVIDAPFGRFTPSGESIFLLDGRRSWMVMELVSPITFVYTYLRSPLSPLSFGTPPPLSIHNPSTVLAILFLIHYANRAVFSPLRTPSRSKSHVIVVLSAILFNSVNGPLLGAYLSSPECHSYLAGAYRRPRFWLGILMWAAGFIGNIVHDEILLNIRRKKQAEDAKKAPEQTAKEKKKGEHYAIPHGLLYKYISFPNYFCEWVEWLGFALAASPIPSFASQGSFLATITPPFLFLVAEVLTMMPRAVRGHQWYRRKFPNYPKERRIVVPFLV
ncbi:3-oxo-5-alpha-steroid 4-dehydrogenase-domain-containing protein [Thelephora terrestris]|uniref:3-oxo-5-alpha-steroid 4-dehydrogenase-domain-containing protein n=1 Tax=Thelephora terrestris TaxID=56493 RepID=A0A9P6H270_9AGAM|nr:3-oxo-5-alpha-steroid 4-dehydrogenase-domain-containing protein [Thelephora terrestris]